MDDLYRDYILEHYRRPHNFGVLDAPDLRWEGANPLCGDRITLMIDVRDGVVADVAFTGRGCAISQASASLLTDEMRGRPLEELEKLTPDDVLDLLGIEISPARLKCALLSLDTLSHAMHEGAVDAAQVEVTPPDGARAADGARASSSARTADQAPAAGRAGDPD
jgi:nitrogen fixation NifU-like protein